MLCSRQIIDLLYNAIKTMEKVTLHISKSILMYRCKVFVGILIFQSLESEHVPFLPIILGKLYDIP